MRLGDIVSGSKGYSVLIDADGKMGASGAYADPNYQAATTGSNGNPGFEYEVVLETNFRVAVYNVDGSSTPVLLSSYGIASNSQVSIAISTVSGTPDYFYDFYVPLSDLKNGVTNVTATTPLRMSATTVMAPQAAIGGPKSDIFGVTGTDYMKSWETLISAQPQFTANDVTATGTGINATCTAAPTLNSPINAGTVTLSGTWTRADVSKPETTIITIYKNGVPLPTTATVSTSGTWSIAGVTAAANDVFYAKAQSTGESSCLQSNSVLVSGCASRTSLSTLSLTCATDRGFDGTAPVGAIVRIYTVTSTGYALFSDESTTSNKITRPVAGTTRWIYDGPNTNSTDPCKGGTVDVPIADYAITVQETGKCESDYYYIYNGTNNLCASTTATPTITQAILYAGNTVVSGTATAGATVRLFKDGGLRATATVTSAGAYSFTNLSLNLGEVLDVYAQVAGSCISTKVTRTVTCFSYAPVITTTASGNLTAGATTITGTSSGVAGATIRVYNSSNTLLATTTLQTNGTWSVPVTVMAGTSYYATGQRSSCTVSAASATASALAATTICPTITGTYNETSTTVSGDLTASFTGTVRLYQDGAEIGSVTYTTSVTKWSITPAANLLYPGGALMATTQTITTGTSPTTSSENTSCTANNSVTITCAPPSAPAVLPSTAVPYDGTSKVKYTITNSQSGVLYTLENTSGVDQGTSVFGTGGSITITSNAFLAAGTYSLRITALKLSGSSCAATSTSVTAIIGDNDQDGVVDGLDADDDNDGIPDSIENGGVSANSDADNDGILNYRDPDFCTPNSKGVCANLDKDGDGIINQFDLDSDNDGIPDLVEAGGVDTNGDGRVDYTGTFKSNDSNGDGMINRYDVSTGGVALGSLDSDGDGILNLFDLDSDNDGVPDIVEAGGTDVNNDGSVDTTTDSDKDGWADAIDGDIGNDGVAENSAAVLILTGVDANNDGRPDSYTRGDFDRDGKLNAYDLDSDGDGILDIWEAGFNAYDSNNNGLLNSSDAGYADLNKDGWFDAIDALSSLTLINTDGTGLPDYLDIDADDDGITDNIEAQASATYKAPLYVDADSDGIDDQYDNNAGAFGGSTGNGLQPVNTDGTDQPDFRDTDADNDNDPDRIEGNDLNGNHKADDVPASIPTTDTDADGLLDFYEVDVASGPIVTIAGFSGGSGSKSTAQKTLASATERDWRNNAFSLSAYVVLPVRFLAINAAAQGAGVLVTWQVTDEREVLHYEVERSLNGTRFTKIAEVAFTQPTGAQNSYRYFDASAPEAVAYYRIRQVDVDGRYTNSNIVPVWRRTAEHQMLVSPNPVTTDAQLLISAAKEQNITLIITNTKGQTVSKQAAFLQKGNNNIGVQCRDLPAGLYFVKGYVDGQMKQTKFLKQ